MGSEIGLHTVYYASEYERVEFTHRASSRDVFAAGAIRAAKWIKVDKIEMGLIIDRLSIAAMIWVVVHIPCLSCLWSSWWCPTRPCLWSSVCPRPLCHMPHQRFILSLRIVISFWSNRVLVLCVICHTSLCVI
jgi:hypothetical protein